VGIKILNAAIGYKNSFLVNKKVLKIVTLALQDVADTLTKSRVWLLQQLKH
jgi:hypothetical protein